MLLIRNLMVFLLLGQASLLMAAEEKNILFLAVDDLRPQLFHAEIEAYNTDLAVTPNLDAFARQCMVFDRAYCQVPVCGASRLSIMTGVRPYKVPGKNYGRFWNHSDHLDKASASGAPAGLNHPKMADGKPAPTLAQFFKERGYITQSIGKIYHHSDDDTGNWTEGATRLKDSWKPYRVNPASANLAYEIGVGKDDKDYPSWEIKEEGVGALRALSRSGKPFFLGLGFTRPHLPFIAPQKYWDMYKPEDIKLPETYYASNSIPEGFFHNFGELRAYGGVQFQPGNKLLEEDYAKTLIRGYYACVSYIDAMVKEVINELDELGIRDNTIIVFWGDHGWNLGDNGIWCKHSLFETSLRVPLYIDAPGYEDGLRSDALVGLVDIYPTLCDLTGFPKPEHLEGASLVPLMTKPDRPWAGASYSHWQRGKSVRTDRYHYAELFTVDDKFSQRVLFDIQADPAEKTNMAETPENRQLVNALSELLNDGWQRAHDTEKDNAPISFTVEPDGSIKDLTMERDELAHRRGTIVVETQPGETIHIEQQAHEFGFGATLTTNAFNGRLSDADTRQYKEVFLENFNFAVTKNALKWRDMQPTPDEVNYSVVDAMLEWTDDHNIPLRGHNIYWGAYMWLQPWIKALSDDGLREALEVRGRDIGFRYKGRFVQYDFNNEMIWENFYVDRLGEGITMEMANWVMSEDPDARLFVNDFDILTGVKLQLYVDHITDLLERGFPLAGIGVQGHLHGDSFDPAAVKNALDKLAKFDLPIVVTEFNFPGQRSKYRRNRQLRMTEEEELYKAQAIADYYRICFEHPAVDGILMWGFWEKENWIPASSLYARDWTPKPALKAYRDLVFDEWWTDVTVKADSDGRVEIPAFYGEYLIKAGERVQKLKLEKSIGSARISIN